MVSDDHPFGNRPSGHRPEPDPDPPRRVRRSQGARAQRQRELARRRRMQLLRRFGLLAVVVGALALILPRYGATIVDGVSSAAGAVGDWVAALGDEKPEATPTDGPTDDGAPTEGPGRTTVLVTTLDETGGDTATAAQLLTYDPEVGRGGIVFVPVSMVADVPGYGLLPLADAGGFGGAPLLSLTLENLLGVPIDANVEVTEQGWAALFARTGGFDVEVRQALAERTSTGDAVRRFEPGAQFLDGPRLAEYLTFVVEGEAELSRFSRAQQVFEGFLAATTSEGLDAVFEDGAPMLQVSDVGVVEATLRGLVDAAGSDAVDVRTLPVTTVGGGDELYYRLDAERAAALASDVLGGPREGTADSGDGMRLEVLNGNGQAGVGADVAELLVPLGHTIVVTRNADDFDHLTTRVLLHGDEEELLLAAQGITEALGVGRIEISTVPSTIVDITIVIGADFRR